MTLRRVRLVRLRRAGDAQRGGSERVDTPSRQRIGVFLLAQLRERGLGAHGARLGLRERRAQDRKASLADGGARAGAPGGPLQQRLLALALL